MIDWKRFELKVFKKGGGGGGGGAGVVDYPDYMKDFHGEVLDDDGSDTPTMSVVAAMNAAMASSPFAAATAYNPDTPIADMASAVDDLETLVDLLSSGTGLDAIIIDMLSDTRIDDSVDEFSTDLAARLNTEVIPRYQAGMRDINAVVSSSFAIGLANIEEGQTREVGKYSAAIHLRAFSDDALRLIALKLEFQKSLTHLAIESNRMKIVAKKEENDFEIKLEEEDALWDLETFQYGSNVLASIGGGVADPKGLKGPSTTASVIGGGLSGAAAGAMVGASYGSAATPYGAAVGAVLGAAAGYLTA